MELNTISPYAKARMKCRGISINALEHLLAHGRVEALADGVRLVCLASGQYQLNPNRIPAGLRTLYALVDQTGDVITVDHRVRRVMDVVA